MVFYLIIRLTLKRITVVLALRFRREKKTAAVSDAIQVAMRISFSDDSRYSNECRCFAFKLRLKLQLSKLVSPKTIAQVEPR